MEQWIRYDTYLLIFYIFIWMVVLRCFYGFDQAYISKRNEHNLRRGPRSPLLKSPHGPRSYVFDSSRGPRSPLLKSPRNSRPPLFDSLRDKKPPLLKSPRDPRPPLFNSSRSQKPPLFDSKQTCKVPIPPNKRCTNACSPKGEEWITITVNEF